jgi:uncharacterized protein YlxP (DUF503 family)
MSIGLLTLHVHIPGCTSLKEKRHRIKPVLARLHRQFNISVAEIDYHDVWQSAMIGCTMISNDPNNTHRRLQQVAHWVESFWPDLSIIDERIEIL